uniref:Uncharacterized protein n=1 Tax=Zea mays TaxID=4577 RepID=A0A804LMH7_MAIZE
MGRIYASTATTTTMAEISTLKQQDLVEKGIFSSYKDIEKLLQALSKEEEAVRPCLVTFYANVLLNLYVKLDPLATTFRLFVGMLERNMVSFVMLMQGYNTHADMYKA